MNGNSNLLSKDKIILFAKNPGKTSFSSLFTIKHALDTTKVGHTGTLDSFASGLLVVCSGSLTRFAGRITEFDKSYEAVLKFGEETDTLECTGKIIKKAPLPAKEAFEKAVLRFTGKQMQLPPVFSALHVDGKRASDVARSGGEIELKEREINVYKAEILDIKLNEKNLVEYAKIKFDVSKGTYIRSLARDIGKECGSASHLTGLFRTRISDFSIENAAGFSRLEKFTIESAVKNAEKLRFEEEKRSAFEIEMMSDGISRKEWKKLWNERNPISEEELKKARNEEIEIQKEVQEKALSMDETLSKLCGFGILHLASGNEKWFRNGGKLSSAMFLENPFELKESSACVFNTEKQFAGLLEKDEHGYFKYAFVNGSL